jgi:hypothetical protein
MLRSPKQPQPRGESPKPPWSISRFSSWSGVDGSDHSMSYTIWFSWAERRGLGTWRELLGLVVSCEL